ncbi:MAG: hypothetical protein GY842_18495 [bacterium]|nr:hypothetical protein [bacterium]
MSIRRVVPGVVLLSSCVVGAGTGGCDLSPDAEPGVVEWTGGTEGQGEVEVTLNGVIATLFARPEGGWLFDHWVGPDYESTENPHNVGTGRVGQYTVVFVPGDGDGDADSNGPADADTNGPTDDVDTSGLPDDADTAGVAEESGEPASGANDDAGGELARFDPVGRDIAARFFHAASRFDNGVVMVTGGLGAEISPPSLVTLDTVSFYDPSTRSFMEIFPPINGDAPELRALHTPRSHHTQTTLVDGKVLIAGGNTGASGTEVGTPVFTVEVYNPQNGRLRELVREMTVPRAMHTATLMSDGRVLVAGPETWQFFIPGEEPWTTDLPLAHSRSAHTAIHLLDFGGVEGAERVLLIGGVGSGADTMELLDPETETTELLEARLDVGLNDLGAVLLPDGRVFIIGGQEVSTGDTVDATYLLDPVADELTPGEPLPNRSGGISDHEVVRLGNHVIVFGGEQEQDDQDTELDYYAVYNLIGHEWVEDGRMSYVHDDFVAVLLDEESALLVGGGVPFLGQEIPSDSAEVFSVIGPELVPGS